MHRKSVGETVVELTGARLTVDTPSRLRAITAMGEGLHISAAGAQMGINPYGAQRRGQRQCWAHDPTRGKFNAQRGPAYGASALALASAALTVYWTAGGTFLLDTVGGSIEDTARAHSSAAILLGTMTSVAKLGAALLALALVRPWGRRIPDRLLAGGNTLISVLLAAWGAANIVLGTLALAGVLAGAGDQRALLWHVLVCGMWFLVWGVVLALAIAQYRRRGRAPRRVYSRSPTGPQCST
jgi:Protein of unknown function (DUF3995)